ncbi:GGDEF domain-containing protein [Lachnospiraceae bacterium]|nr:GGDEF domain-containing protein [Lachnospiraceae bacterium]
MNGEKNTKNKMSVLRGVRIRTLSLWIVAGTILVSVLIGDGIINVMNQHQKLAGMTQEYLLIKDNVADMSRGSDYLTEQARLYAITKDYNYADAYFQEVGITQRRDKALLEIEHRLQGKDPDAFRLSKEALELSNELMELEIHSMKLAALSVGEALDSLPAQVQDYPLTDAELQYTSQEKSEAASQLVFGQEYRAMKQQIDERLTSVTQSVTSICELDLEKSEKSMKNALTRQSIYTILVVMLVIFSYIMIAVLILRPIRIYVNCIKNNNFLEITGAYEFKYLAATYNNIFEMSMEQQNVLRRKAECDALTGLLNRQAFEQLKERLQGKTSVIALLLIDIDVFKSINDTYGHEMGDKALINAANILKESFRRADHVLRIGGDEFAIVMEKVQPDKPQIISEKIDKINWILQHPQNDLPKYSISVGIAFSENGYSDELFRQADQALYHTKENGRCGYTFYQS